jgi:tRNA-2-methylthio-N6-dimethylallyladenosine synthase
MSGKLFIKTHGCQMNEYDSAKMADVLKASHGLELTQDESEADVILVNTCSIREKAQEKVFSQLGRWKEYKQGGKAVLIGVGGCVASQEGDAIIKRAPYVDLVFGPQTLHRLPELIEAKRATGKPQVDISFPRSKSSTACRNRAPKAPPPSSRSWKAAPSTAPTAWCPTPAARKSAARSTTWWSKSPSSPRRACARSTCWARTSTPTAARPTTAAPPIWPC